MMYSDMQLVAYIHMKINLELYDEQEEGTKVSYIRRIDSSKE